MNMHECQNQLDWSAFCYLAGELSPAEAEQFEARLADDQAAREALARAVELTQVVAAAESQCGDLVSPATRMPAGGMSRRESWTTRLSWMAIGGLASLALAMLWTGYQSGRYPSGTWNRGNLSGNDALASAWSQTRDALQDAADPGPLHPMSPANADDFDEAVEREDVLAAADEAPSWMTAAVAGLADEMDVTPDDSDPL